LTVTLLEVQKNIAGFGSADHKENKYELGKNSMQVSSPIEI